MRHTAAVLPHEFSNGGARLGTFARPLAVALALLGGGAAQAATLFWDGTGTSWAPAEGWSAVETADTPDPAAAPDAADVAAFSVDGVSSLQAVTLGASQAAAMLSVRGSAAGGLVLTGGGTDRTLSLGTGGLEALEGAGPVAVGSTAAGQGVAISLTA